MTEISQFEMALLRQMAGYNVDVHWGAATGQALEYLVKAGYVYRDTSGDVYTYILTQKGIDAACGPQEKKND